MVQKLDFLFTLAIKKTVLRDFWGVFVIRFFVIRIISQLGCQRAVFFWQDIKRPNNIANIVHLYDAKGI